MEEAKAASYYDELTRKGNGAARFKQGLGFSSSSSSSSSLPLPSKPSSSPSPLFSTFVRATSPAKAEKQAQLQSIQAKLRRPHRSSSSSRDALDLHRRSSCREMRRDRARVCRSRSRDRRRRSRSWSEEEVEDREGDYRNRNARRRSRSRSPSRVLLDLKKDCGREEGGRWNGIAAEKGGGLECARLIEGYLEMTPAERVRAKMKLQLSQTAAKDSTMGMSSGWERFDFNKDAPLDDDDDEIEVAEDDASLVKEIGNSFRYSAVQAKREEQIKAAHDEAMFGASAMAPTIPESDTYKDEEKTDNENQDNNLLISDKVLAMQRGSWRDRVGRFKSGSD